MLLLKIFPIMCAAILAMASCLPMNICAMRYVLALGSLEPSPTWSVSTDNNSRAGTTTIGERSVTLSPQSASVTRPAVYDGVIEVQFHLPEGTLQFTYEEPTPTPSLDSPNSDRQPLIAPEPVITVEGYIEAFNERFPDNAIPSFVICSSWNRAPRMYTQTEIFLAIQSGLRDLQTPLDPASRRHGPTWPRVLGYFSNPALRPRDIGDASDLLIEYPLRRREDESGSNDGVLDRVIFDTRGLFVGIMRYHGRNNWHYCYPEGFTGLFTPRRASRVGVSTGPVVGIIHDHRPLRWQPGHNRCTTQESSDVPAPTPEAEPEVPEEDVLTNLPADDWGREHGDEIWMVSNSVPEPSPVVSDGDGDGNGGDDPWWEDSEPPFEPAPVEDDEDAWWMDDALNDNTPITADDDSTQTSTETMTITGTENAWWDETVTVTTTITSTETETDWSAFSSRKHDEL
ncbi:hypothetical protein F5Y04DRAFT_284772 [Hypomontagnella monticulosa]|nr:hypothetical protein F5Y04DRAFT_284772 [Hypomontagnella monticulosa]